MANNVQDEELDDQQQHQHEEEARTAETQTQGQGGDDEDDDEDEEDEERSGKHEDTSGNADDSELEELRARRREERRRKKQAAREREDGYRREIAARDTLITDLSARIEAIERRNAGASMAQLDAAINEAETAYASWNRVHGEAVKAQNGEAAAQAMDAMMASRERASELKRIKQYQAQQARQPQAPQIDPRIMEASRQWMKDKPWYDPAGRNTESRIVLSIDSELVQEGWSPISPQYWEELDKRVKRFMPHLYQRQQQSGGDGGQQRNGDQKRNARGPVGSDRDSGGNTQNTNSYKLSAERVQAMKDAGMWDDPKLREQAIKRYREYDKQQVKG